jgi:hypothetical protein
MSQEPFRFIQIPGWTACARKAHLPAVHWLFAFASMHLGLHLDRLPGMFRPAQTQKKADKAPKRPPPAAVWALRLLGLAIAVMGVRAFIKHNLWAYMTMQVQFQFFDMEQPLPGFLADCLSMAVMWALAAHALKKLARRMTARGPQVPQAS